MKVLITAGATSYLAQFLLQHLSTLTTVDIDLVYTYRSTPVEQLPPGMPGTPVHLDIADPETFASALATKPEIVINCAVVNPRNPEDEAYATNVNAPTSFFAALSQLEKPPLVIQLSTDMVFDGEKAPYQEGDSCHPINAYGRSKAVGEKSLSEAPLRGVVLRSSNILGPPSPFTHTGKFLQWLEAALKTDDQCVTLWEDNIRCFIWVTDICRIVAAIVVQELQGQGGLLLPSSENGTVIFNMGGPERLSRVDIGHLVCEARGVDKARVVPVPTAQVLGPDALAQTPRDLSMDSEAVFTAAGFNAQSITEGLAGYKSICSDKYGLRGTPGKA